MDIKDYSFNYKQVTRSNHPAMPAIFEALVTDNVNKISYGTKFQHPPGAQIDNSAVFNAFKDKNNFKNNWWVEIIEDKKEVVVEKPIDISPEPVKVEEKKEELNVENKVEQQGANN